MSSPINKSEEFVYKVCRRSFLALWSYANPKGKQGKELCDILVVCDPDVIVISVKEIGVTDSGDMFTDGQRWLRRAITKSATQIYRAERWIKTASHVLRKDGSEGLPLPDVPQRRIHRVAIALGGDRKVPIQFGNFGKGFVHVFDGVAFQVIMSELDTITDFIEYLSAKEEMYQAKVETTFHGGEEDLLALYLHHGRKFPRNYAHLVISDDLWSGFRSRAEYRAKKEADKDSYVWDKLIEVLAEFALEEKMEFGKTLSENEVVLRCLAHEDRFARRLLSVSFKTFLERARAGEVRARVMSSPSGVGYVFFAAPPEQARELRMAELANRCFIARNESRDCITIIGIGLNVKPAKEGFATDLCLLSMPTWTEEDRHHAERMKAELGYFKAPRVSRLASDEYPNSQSPFQKSLTS